MKIVGTHVMRGPNRWSINHHKLIVIEIETGEWNSNSTGNSANLASTFCNKLKAAFGNDFGWAFSENIIGQFDEGALVGYMVAVVAQQLQKQAGVDCNYCTANTKDGSNIVQAVFEYVNERLGLLTAEIAVEIVESFLTNKDINVLMGVEEIREMWESVKPGQITGNIVGEAIKRKIPIFHLDNMPLVQLGYGANHKRIQLSVTGQTSSIGGKIASNKERTKKLLRSLGVPVPMGKLIFKIDGLESAIEEIGYPIVLKPVNGRQGNGVSVNITNLEDAKTAFQAARRIAGAKGVVLEKYITGSDYRLLVVGYKFVAATKRTPAMIIGDGKSTIEKLIDKVNSDPMRGTGHSKPLTSIEMDETTHHILMENNLTLDSVLPANKPLFLKLIANLSVGGTSSDATELVHPDNIFMAERIAKIVDLDICGMDIISPDIGVPLNLNGASVVEVNSAPGIRLHLEPTEGKPRNVAGSIIDMLFPEDNAWRIPIIAVAGTGNTIVCDLAAAMFTQIGQKVGCATSKGIYSQNVLIAQGDCTHYKHAELVLKDPMVDFAIFECGLSSILENGLAFYNCDIGIVVNIAKDGFVGNTQDMQKAAYLVPACVLPTGYAILNADDEAVYNMHKGLKCNIAYFSMHRNNPIIIDHIKNGGLAAMVEDGFFTVCDGMDKIKMMEVDELSDLSGNGKINIVQNILAFILVGWICKIETFVMKTLFEGYLKNQ